MEKKQTAVQLLVEQLGLDSTTDYKEEIQQALQMEREQIEEVAMYHKDSSVDIDCIRSYVKKNYGGQDE
jgi:hypothetical protein